MSKKMIRAMSRREKREVKMRGVARKLFEIDKKEGNGSICMNVIQDEIALVFGERATSDIHLMRDISGEIQDIKCMELET